MTWPPIRVSSDQLTGFRPHLMSLHAEQVKQAFAADVDITVVGPIVARWRAMTEQQRAAASAVAIAERERRDQETRGRRERHVRETWERYTAVLNRYLDQLILRAVVELHAPDETWIEECTGCPPGTDREGDDVPADWPCPTFLLIEEAT